MKPMDNIVDDRGIGAERSVPTKCRHCDVMVEFVRTATGSYVPVEIDNRVTVLTKNGMLYRGDIVHHGRCKP